MAINKPSEKHSFVSCKCFDSYVTEFTTLLYIIA